MLESDDDPTVELQPLTEAACAEIAVQTSSEIQQLQAELELRDEMNAVLQAGIEEQRAKSRRLEAEIARLKNRNEELVARLGSQQKSVNGARQDSIVVQVEEPAAVTGEQANSYTISDGIVTIGSGPDNDIRVESMYVSHRHAQLVMTRKGCVLTDLESTNGTFINSRRIITRTLETGDTVTVGKHRFLFEKPPGQENYRLSAFE